MSPENEDKTVRSDQFLGLANELETATFLLVEGLIAMNSLSAANDFVHLPLQLLGQGLERLLKVEVVLLHVEEIGTVPDSKSVKTHDLITLLERLLASERLDAYRQARIAAEEDVEFLESDHLFRRLLKLMSSFAAGGRYFDLDSALNVRFTEARSSPADDFSRVEMELLRAHPEWEVELANAAFSGFYPVLYGDLTETIQRGIRAIARLMVWDFLGSLGKRLSGTMIATFLVARDNELRNPPRRWFES